MLLAAMLAMLLVSAVPAFAQEVTFGDDGDDFEQGDDSTNQFVESDQFSVADFGDQNASIEQNVTGDNNQTDAAIGQDQNQFSDQVIQNSLADDDSFAFNDSDFDGIDDDFDNSLVFGDFDNDGINDQFENGNDNVFEDADFDGIEDDSDVSVVFGDFDNDGVNDEEEFGNGFNDSDFDGIADIFDAFFVFGDFDNDGINDQFELGTASTTAWTPPRPLPPPPLRRAVAAPPPPPPLSPLPSNQPAAGLARPREGP